MVSRYNCCNSFAVMALVDTVCTSEPPRIIPIRAPTFTALKISCVAMKMVLPSAASSLQIVVNSAVALGSRPLVGSSIKIRSAFLAIAMAMPGQRAGMLNTGPHGLSEVLYAFTSAGNNNGSAFAGLSVDTDWYNTALGLAMVFGRFLPIIVVLALAGSLAKQGTTPESIGTLPTHRPQFVGMLTGVTLILVALTFLPMLALGPLAEGIH